MNKPYSIVGALALNVLAASAVLAQDYDVVITEGRVMDPETLYDDVANVGIKDGPIATLTKDKISGCETIKAKGKVVALGFIDTQFHFQMPVGYSLGLRDGLTTTPDYETGGPGSYMAQWYEDRAGVSVANYGIAASHESARATVLDGADGDFMEDGPISALTTRKGTGWSQTRPTLEQANAILQEIDKGLQAGASGSGSSMGYMREGASSRQLFEVQKLGTLYGCPIAAHTRYTPGNDTEENNGQQELIANAVALGAPAITLHINININNNNDGWRLAHELTISLQEQGYIIWAEVYPYVAGATTINASFLEPEVWIDKMGKRYEDTMLHPVTNTFYTLETYKEAVASDPSKLIVLFKQPEENIAKWLALKGVTMSSDAVAALSYDAPWDYPLEKMDNMHRRTAGARAKTIRR